MRIPFWLKWLSLGGASFFLIAGLVLPLGSALWGVTPRIFDPAVLNVALFTLKQASLSAALSLLIGLPLGLWVKGSRRVEAILSLPFGIPTLVVAIAWLELFGKSGIFGSVSGRGEWVFSLTAVIATHVLLNAPWIALRVSQSRKWVSRRTLEAAATLGAGRAARFAWIVWPEIRGPVFSATCQVFSLCAMSFTLVLLLGGGPPVDTLETAIFSRLRYSGLDLKGAMGCAFWQSLMTLIPWWWVERAERGTKQNPLSFPREKTKWSFGFGLKVFVASLFVLPYAWVVISAFTNLSSISEFDLNETWSSLRLSLQLAFGTAITCVVFSAFGVLAAASAPGTRSIWRTVFVLPSGLSTLVLSLALWLAYERWIDFFSGSTWILIAAQSLIFVPLVFRIFWDASRGTQSRLLEAALTLGASPFQAFRAIEWPRWRGPLFTGFLMTFIASLGEVAAISLFASESARPMPLLISRLMGQYRFAEAELLGAGLVLLVAGTTLGLGWFQARERWLR